jgi:hypothetical protein
VNDEISEALSRTTLLARDFVPDDVPDDAIVRGLRATNVALLADAHNLASGACQSSVVTLAQLLVATGFGLRFVGPDVRLVGSQPPWTSRTLYGVLDEMRSARRAASVPKTPSDAPFRLPWRLRRRARPAEKAPPSRSRPGAPGSPG